MSPRIGLAGFVSLILLSALGGAQAQRYGMLPDSIPDRYEATSLNPLTYKEKPSAVVRLEARRLVIEGPGEATLHARKVVTVYDEGGRHYGRQDFPYDSFVEIERLDGRVLNEEGKTIKELDDEYVNDRSMIGGSLYNDARVKVAKLFADSYPYTVEYWYELEYTTPLRWPTWYPEDRRAPTDFAQFEVEVPDTYEIRYDVRGDVPKRIIESREDRRIARWRVADRSAYDREPRGPSWFEQAPAVHVAPTVFETAGIQGDMSTWSAFGRWYHELKKSRDELSPESAKKMRQMVEGAATRRDTVRRLYRHLQRETRYVSVQLGIGGWQPFPVSYVQKRGYGDCKALTNYLEAALESVGIPAHPVLIYRGTDPPPLSETFPSNPFNHAVLAVPMERDTLWLENTDTAPAFGQVGYDIADRHALMVTAEGGEFVRTPSSTAAENKRVHTATVQLKAGGGGTATVETAFTGNNQYLVREQLAEKSSRERKEWLRERLDVPSFNLNGVDFSEVDSLAGVVHLPVELGLPRYAAKTGSRLFLPLNLMSRRSDVPPEMDQPRTQPVHAQPYPFVTADSIRYELPSGYGVEAVPEPVTIERDFATYEASVERTKDALVYRRRLEWRTKTLPPEQYEAFRTFLKEVAQADEAQAVLVEQES